MDVGDRLYISLTAFRDHLFRNIAGSGGAIYRYRGDNLSRIGDPAFGPVAMSGR